MSALGLVHRFVPGRAGAPTLLLLHGTGGNEDDLLPLGQELLPGAALLSPRGAVLEGGMPRFFRRIAEGVFDLEDLARRTKELAAFVTAARAEYGVEQAPIVAVGYSNGANIAANLLLTGTGVLDGAVLLRAMVPSEPAVPADLAGRGVLLLAGDADPIAGRQPERLASLLRAGGASVDLVWQPAGHGLVRADLDAARAWLLQHVANSGSLR
jgi:predicted esterase